MSLISGSSVPPHPIQNRLPEERLGVEAVLAEAAAGSDVEDGDLDLCEVVVEVDGRLAAGGGVGVRELLVGLKGRRALLQAEEVLLVGIEQARRFALGVEGAAG